MSVVDRHPDVTLTIPDAAVNTIEGALDVAWQAWEDNADLLAERRADSDDPQRRQRFDAAIETARARQRSIRAVQQQLETRYYDTGGAR